MSEGTPALSAAAARPGRKQICGRLRAVVRDLPRLQPGGAGADYVDADTDYSGQGVDQLREVIRKIKEDPTDRRIIMSAWNPAG